MSETQTAAFFESSTELVNEGDQRFLECGNLGEGQMVNAGVLNEQAEFAYQEGQCLALALAIHEITGWQLMWASTGTCYECADTCSVVSHIASHIFVQTPEGKALDIRGLRKVSKFSDILWWAEYAGTLSSEDVLALLKRDDWYVPDMGTARVFARALLEKISDDENWVCPMFSYRF